MSVISVIHEGDEWDVWINLDGDSFTAPEGFSFVIGRGRTRDEAVAAAVKDLEAAVEQLQQPV